MTDTPGLLNRPDADRNAMERLTLASLQHLPTAVLFVADLTGQCGTSVADQWAIRWVQGPVRVKGPACLRVAWLACLCLLRPQRGGSTVAHGQPMLSPLRPPPARSYLRSRFPTKPWLDVFSKEDLLEEELDEADALIAAAQRAQHGEMSGEAAGSSGGLAPAPDTEPGPGGVATAVAFAAALPRALRVSSLTGAGVEGLKGAMLCMLDAADLRSEGLEAWAEEGAAGAAGAAEGSTLIYASDSSAAADPAYYD